MNFSFCFHLSIATVFRWIQGTKNFWQKTIITDIDEKLYWKYFICSNLILFVKKSFHDKAVFVVIYSAYKNTSFQSSCKSYDNRLRKQCIALRERRAHDERARVHDDINDACLLWLSWLNSWQIGGLSEAWLMRFCVEVNISKDIERLWT